MYLHFPDCAIGRWMCLDGLTKNIKHNWVFDWCFPLEHQLSWYIEFAQIHVFTGATDVSKKNLYQHSTFSTKKSSTALGSEATKSWHHWGFPRYIFNHEPQRIAFFGLLPSARNPPSEQGACHSSLVKETGAQVVFAPLNLNGFFLRKSGCFRKSGGNFLQIIEF